MQSARKRSQEHEPDTAARAADSDVLAFKGADGFAKKQRMNKPAGKSTVPTTIVRDKHTECPKLLNTNAPSTQGATRSTMRRSSPTTLSRSSRREPSARPTTRGKRSYRQRPRAPCHSPQLARTWGAHQRSAGAWIIGLTLSNCLPARSTFIKRAMQMALRTIK